MHIKVKSGRLIRDPVTRALLPEQGVEVSDTDLYYHRLLNDGDIELTQAPQQPNKDSH